MPDDRVLVGPDVASRLAGAGYLVAGELVLVTGAVARDVASRLAGVAGGVAGEAIWHG